MKILKQIEQLNACQILISVAGEFPNYLKQVFKIYFRHSQHN